MRKISDDEIRFFDENGYVICRKVLHADELAHFQRESARLIDEIQSGGPADKMCTRGPEGIPYYLTYLHANPNTFSLRLLAHPFIGDLLTRMVGPDFIPCYESLVFKLPGNGSSVPWHRDGNAETGRERVFNIDIYPDYSTVANSCVWVVPGSHLWERERAMEMVKRGREDFNLPNAVPAEMEPGDVLLHHVKVLHGSTVNSSQELRRVVYFDNRAASWNDEYKWFSREVIEKRCRLYQYALNERKKNPYPSDDEVFAYTPPEGLPTWNPGDPIDLLARRDSNA
ncbi:MAG TPA: phytanoyl-CoA dioxygenase family protein [Chthonomonadaceae bacterium]|nr:phytanoyl-CoA dioxygenase family protein [Chthonomonadaceae bacterium]